MSSHTHQKNQDFFNNEAASYDAKHEKTLGHIIGEIRSRLDFIGVDWVDDDEDEDEDDDDNSLNGGDDKQPDSNMESGQTTSEKVVRLLDYACGTGVVSRALAPYTTQCVGIDLSENMVATYNARAANQGLRPDEMHAYQGNLCVPDEPNPSTFASLEFQDFEIAAVGLGFHHFDDPELAAQRLVERLRPGGVLFILDFLPHGEFHTHHPAAHTVTHHGFSPEHIQNIFTKAGAGKDFALQEISKDVVFNRPASDSHGSPEMRRRIFLARGTKA